MSFIEPSKSSRSKCRICKEKIEKGIARVAVQEEVTMGSNTFLSTKYHHLECTMKSMPDEVLTADVKEGVSQEEIAQINEFKQRKSKAGTALKGLADITEGNEIVNTEVRVLRKVTPRETEHESGKEMFMSTVYVKDEDAQSKLLLWGDHANLEIEKGDRIVVINGMSKIALNESIEIHTGAETKVLINPTAEDLSSSTKSIELYVSKAWRRPRGKPAEFQIAPSGRASCPVCEDKLEKGEIKLVKPSFIELEGQNRTVPGNVSFHLHCILEDPEGSEVVHEAITRLTPTFIADNREKLQGFKSDHLDTELSSILDKIL